MFADLDYNYVKDPINELFDVAAPALVGIGYALFDSVALLIFVVYLFVYGWGLEAVIRFVMRYFLRLVFGNVVLGYFDKPLPIPGLTLSFHEIPAAMCDTVVSYLDMKRLDELLNFFKSLLDALQVPAANVLLQPLVWAGASIVNFYDDILWASIALSYQAVGVMTVILPLFVFALLIPGISSMFWNCWSGVWQAAFYRVTASVIVFCACTSTLSFLAKEMNGDYSLESFIVVLPKLCALMLSWVASFFVVGHLTADIWKGTSHTGGSFGNFVAGQVKRVR